MISVAILAFNEEANLAECLASLSRCDDVVVIDSGSTDRTVAIAKEAGARVFEHPFTGHGDQRNWAMANAAFRHPWVLFLDADERVTPELWDEMCAKVAGGDEALAAFRLKRRLRWEGRWLRHANLYPTWVVRLARLGRVRYVNRGHAETQEIDGRLGTLGEDLLDDNRKGLESWQARQCRYAEEEARYELTDGRRWRIADLLSREPLHRRAAWKALARHLPARGACYFIYSAILRGGWRDGWTGIRFCLEKARFQNQIARLKREFGGTLPRRADASASETSGQMETSRPPVKPWSGTKRALFVMSLPLWSLLLVALVGEVTVRLFFRQRYATPTDERCLAYRYDSMLGWFPVPGSEGQFLGSRRIHFRHNSQGFRDREHGSKEKPRMAFLGDSFVWGYDVEQDERFTDRLQGRLPGWEILNMGVSGYGTDQEFLLFTKTFGVCQPDVLFLIYHPYTDEIETRWNYVYDGYYKPYFVREKGTLVPCGLPVPKGVNYFYVSHPFWSHSFFVRACVKGFVESMNPRVHVPDLGGNLIYTMKTFCDDRRVSFAVGLVDDCPTLEGFCRENAIRTVKLKNSFVYPSHGGHWTPQGHAEVSRILYDFPIFTKVGWIGHGSPISRMNLPQAGVAFKTIWRVSRGRIFAGEPQSAPETSAQR